RPAPDRGRRCSTTEPTRSRAWAAVPGTGRSGGVAVTVLGGGEGVEETGHVPGGGSPRTGPGTPTSGWGGRCPLAVASAGWGCGGAEQGQLGGQAGARLAHSLLGDRG